MVNLASVDSATLERVVLQHDVDQFLYKEARLLDERRLVEWLDLLADELHYWMPMRRNIKFGDWDMEFTSAETEINWFDEGKDILAGRIRQIDTGVHWPEEPVSRFEHLVSNVEVVSAEGDDIRVNSKFHCYQNRLQDEVNQWVGRREDLLRRDPDTKFKLVKRKIILAQNVMLPKVLNTFL
ncbi:MAG TPA: 3-phenylpropionate/cinnamic acid dioxygenase subunit beta [Dehalococcoidia bacterium]|nr:3-phenylpropionate/cinnamic acid dioxygenase subunit beta [Dehalococcoidia bacterium]